MKSILALAAGAALLAPVLAPTAAYAGSTEGKWQIKVLGTAVLPDGKISEVRSILPALAANPVFAAPQTTASDNYVPTVAIEYFFTPNFSLETICCTTEHHVNGAGSLAGTRLIDNALIVPATFTAKYHMPLGAIKPYVGVGPSLYIVLNSKPGATATALGVTRAKLSTSLGVAAQVGVDIALGKSGFGLNLDAKKYWTATTARFYVGSTEALVTRHKLDPWLLSAGVSYRF